MTSLPGGLSMWSRACEMIDQAERRHRRFFELLAASSQQPAWEPPVDMFVLERELLVKLRWNCHRLGCGCVPRVICRGWRIGRASCGWRFRTVVSSVALSCPQAAMNCLARSWSTVVCASAWRGSGCERDLRSAGDAIGA